MNVAAAATAPARADVLLLLLLHGGAVAAASVSAETTENGEPGFFWRRRRWRPPGPSPPRGSAITRGWRNGQISQLFLWSIDAQGISHIASYGKVNLKLHTVRTGRRDSSHPRQSKSVISIIVHFFSLLFSHGEKVLPPPGQRKEPKQSIIAADHCAAADVGGEKENSSPLSPSSSFSPRASSLPRSYFFVRDKEKSKRSKFLMLGIQTKQAGDAVFNGSVSLFPPRKITAGKTAFTTGHFLPLFNRPFFLACPGMKRAKEPKTQGESCAPSLLSLFSSFSCHHRHHQDRE